MGVNERERGADREREGRDKKMGDIERELPKKWHRFAATVVPPVCRRMRARLLICV